MGMGFYVREAGRLQLCSSSTGRAPSLLHGFCHQQPGCSRCSPPVLSPSCSGLEVTQPAKSEAGPGPRNVQMGRPQGGTARVPWTIHIFEAFPKGTSGQGGLPHNQG